MATLLASLAEPFPDALFAPGFGDGRVERLQVAHLDRAGALLRLFVGEAGSAVSASVPMRRIVADALAAGAHGWIVAHNHPAGDPWPSRADLLVTRRLQAIADGLDIRLHDHLIYGDVVDGCRRRFSFRDGGLL